MSVILDKNIGKGAYSKVYSTTTGLAYKKYTDKKLDTDETVLKELSVMKILNDNVYATNYLKPILNKRKIKGFLMKKYPLDLISYIKTENNIISVKQATKIFYQILVGLYKTHYKYICHADLKPDNILIDDNGDIVIADWGISQFMLLNKIDHEIQTLWYRAPELLLGATKYNFKVDVWSAACIFIEILTGNPLFKTYSKTDQLDVIFKLVGTPTEKNWSGINNLAYNIESFPKYKAKQNWEINIKLEPNILNLVQNMLKINPENRYSVTQALNHEVFNDFRNSQFVEIPETSKNIEDLKINIKRLDSLPVLQINSNYLDINKINNDRRKILLNWLFELTLKYKYNTTTYMLAVYYTDKLLSSTPVHDTRLKLFVITSLYIASIINEPCNEPFSEPFDKLIGDCIDFVSDGINAVRTFLKYLEYNVLYVIEIYYLQHFAFYLNMDKYCYNLSEYLILNSTKYCDYLKYNKKLLVIGACLISIYSINKSDKNLLIDLNIDSADKVLLRNCILFLISTHQKTKNNLNESNSKLAKKYSSNKLSNILTQINFNC